METFTPSRAIRAVITDDTLNVDLEDGRTISVPIVWYPRLAYGTPAERANFQSGFDSVSTDTQRINGYDGSRRLKSRQHNAKPADAG